MKAQILLISLFVTAQVFGKNLKDWPAIKIYTEFELDAPRLYRFEPTSKELIPLDKFSLNIKFDGANNRNLITVNSPYPMKRNTTLDWWSHLILGGDLTPLGYRYWKGKLLYLLLPIYCW
eukprot:403345860